MYLIDTNIVSELCRPKPNAGVVRWAKSVNEFTLSAITVEEIFYGLSSKPNQRLLAWFSKFFAENVNVIAVTWEIAQQAGKLRGTLQQSGVSRSQADILIAATAINQNLTVVTRNQKDFDQLPVTILNPFGE